MAPMKSMKAVPKAMKAPMKSMRAQDSYARTPPELVGFGSSRNSRGFQKGLGGENILRPKP